MRRIGLGVVLTVSTLLAPPAAETQQAVRTVYRIGFLYGGGVTSGAPVFEQSLRELGWVKGRNITIEYRSAEGNLELLPEYSHRVRRSR
jgi:putative ABC transport system substrate-binding protein